MKYRVDGSEKLLSFGKYPSVTLAQARTLRDDAKAMLAKGKDPGVVKQDQRLQRKAASEHTFASLALKFME